MTAAKLDQHPLDERCFFCATDAELMRVIQGDRALYMRPASFCPHSTEPAPDPSTPEPNRPRRLRRVLHWWFG